MYTVVMTEHFEDWYVADLIIGKFNTLEKAIVAFSEVCQNIFAGKYSTSGIDQFIDENFGTDDEFISDYTGGFMVSICSDGDIITSRHFEYDYESRSIKNDSVT